MSIQEQIGPLLRRDFDNQNALRLKEWFSRFPEAENILKNEVGMATLKYALRENLWISSTFLLRVPFIPQKALQVQTASDNPHQACPMLIRAHVQQSDKAKMELLEFLHSRGRL